MQFGSLYNVLKLLKLCVKGSADVRSLPEGIHRCEVTPTDTHCGSSADWVASVWTALAWLTLLFMSRRRRRRRRRLAADGRGRHVAVCAAGYGRGRGPSGRGQLRPVVSTRRAAAVAARAMRSSRRRERLRNKLNAMAGASSGTATHL